MSTSEYRKKNALIKALLITGVFFTLLIGSGVFYYYGSKISGQIIRQIVSEKTNGNYVLTFDDIKLSYAKKDIELTGISISRSGRNTEEITSKYSIEVPKLFLSLKSVFDIYLKRELTLNHVEIIDPYVSILRDGEQYEQKSLSFETGNLYEMVNEYIKSFAIDSLKLNNGGISYTRKDSSSNELHLVFENIRFEISKFLLDQNHDNSEKFLLTENIILSLTDQKIDLPDSIHFVSFDKFSLSTRDQGITFENLKLSKGLNKDSSSDNEYDIQIDYLKFLGVEFNKAYQENKMILKSAEVINPRVAIVNNKRFGNGKSKNDFGELILNVFGELQISKLHLKNGSGSFQSNLNGNQNFKTGQVDLILDNFKLDSTNYQLTDIREFYNGLDIKVRNQRMLTPDSSHVLKIRSINYSNLNAQLNISGAEINPVKEDAENAVVAYFPTVQFSNFILENFIDVQEMVFDDIIFFNPSISSTISMSRSNDSGIKPFLIKGLKVYNGNLEITSPYFHSSLNSCDLNVENIGSHYFNEEILLDSLQFNRFRVGSLEIKTKESIITGSSLRCSKDLENLECYNLSVSKADSSALFTNKYVKLAGINFTDLIQYKRVRLPYILLQEPFVEIRHKTHKQKSKAISPWIKNSLINKIDIDNGDLSILNHGLQTLSITDLVSQISNLSYSNQDSVIDYLIDAKANHVSAYLPGIKHQISLHGFEINENDSSLFIADFSIKPKSNEPLSFEALINGKEIKLNGLDLSLLKLDQRIDFKTGSVSIPDFSLNILDSIRSQSAKNEKFMVFDSLTIFNEQFQVTNKLNTAKGSGIQVTVLDFDSQNKNLKSGNYKGQVNSLSIFTKEFNEGINLNINEFDTKKGHFSLANISANRSKEWYLEIPNMDINHLDILSLTETGIIDIDSIYIDRPNLSLGAHKTGNNKNNNHHFVVRSLNINEGEISRKLPEEAQQDSLFLHSLDIRARDFILKQDWKQSLTDMSELQISGSDFSYTMPDSLYTLVISNYTFDAIQGNLHIREVALEPIYNRGEFQNHISYQKDWFNGFIESIEVTGVEMKPLIYDKVVEADKIDVYQLNLDTHRDKRIPKEPNLYKPLPQTMLRNIPLKISLDTISFLDSYISHSEFSETGEQPGLIFFQDVNGGIFNFTNIDSLINEKPTMLFKSSGKLMYTGDFVIQVKFDLNDFKDPYHFQGHVGGMELTEMNRFLENTAFVHVRDGICESVEFSFDANEDYAMGQMEFYYDNLKISVINQDTYDMKGLGNSLKSFFANTFVVNTKNPHFLFLRDGDIFFERDTTKSIFNYWGKSLLSGVVSSIGATNNKKEIKQKNEEVRKALEAKAESP